MLELDMWRPARQMIDLYDLDAGRRAGLRGDQLLEDGDVDGFDVWVRVKRQSWGFRQLSQAIRYETLTHSPGRLSFFGKVRFRIRKIYCATT